MYREYCVTLRIANIMKRQSKIRIATWKNESRFVSWPYDILCYALTLESKLQNLQEKHIIYVSRYVSHRDDHMEISILSWEKCVVAPLHNGLSPVWRQAITLSDAVCCNLGAYEQLSIKFESKVQNCHTWKCICNIVCEFCFAVYLIEAEWRIYVSVN